MCQSSFPCADVPFDGDVIELVEERLETDAEYEKRLSDAEEHQKQVQAQKVAQFEALKKELGK